MDARRSRPDTRCVFLFKEKCNSSLSALSSPVATGTPGSLVLCMGPRLLQAERAIQTGCAPPIPPFLHRDRLLLPSGIAASPWLIHGSCARSSPCEMQGSP
ncbi:F-box/LRR-repeat protein 19 [Platysternon megacephalum]|uniref:F-box/LRR-repeat protein 19 n=1 Tax=Platysternon megacephalum TaxID=55544 RepID=A0A4D9DQX7_9SAUR|nr:F-box/LRR-repeat protein 19 [Platysternon megacephalum]